MVNITVASKDMPEHIKPIFDESRLIFLDSPRAAAALLRLCVQHLCKELGGQGKNINDDIKELVKREAIGASVQQALDSVRIKGNRAVHPSEIDFNDNQEKALKLFKLVNFIVEKGITEPRELESFYEDIPEAKRKEIERRDKNGG